MSLFASASIPVAAADEATFTNTTSGTEVVGYLKVYSKYTYATTRLYPNYNGGSVKGKLVYMVGDKSYIVEGSTVNGQGSVATTVSPSSSHPTAQAAKGESWHSGPYVNQRHLMASRI
jgi:hypothetical protein